MSVEKKIEELEKLLTERLEEKRTIQSSMWIKYIPIIVLAAGLIASWTTNQLAVDHNQKQIEKLEENYEKQEGRVQDIQLKAVQESSDLKSVKEDMKEIKQDIKDIKNKIFDN